VRGCCGSKESKRRAVLTDGDSVGGKEAWRRCLCSMERKAMGGKVTAATALTSGKREGAGGALKSGGDSMVTTRRVVLAAQSGWMPLTSEPTAFSNLRRFSKTDSKPKFKIRNVTLPDLQESREILGQQI
jgi:hypothetical protein